MNNTVLAGLIVGTVVVAGAGAVAVNSGFNPFQEYATVVAVEPAFDTNQVPRQVCGDDAALDPAVATGLPPAAQSGKVGETTEEPCTIVYDTQSIAVGFDVTYELDGVQRVVRMDRDPGKRIPVEGGELVLSQL